MLHFNINIRLADLSNFFPLPENFLVARKKNNNQIIIGNFFLFALKKKPAVSTKVTSRQ